MGRTPCCDKNNGLKKGPWTPEEDQKLVHYIHQHGYGNWRTLPINAGLQRCGKSCRLRWTNYLRPDIKRGRFSLEEEEIIIQLHSILGNKWSAIASRLPGRTDNEIKNFWNTHIRKKLLRMGIDPVTHAPRLDLLDLSSIFLTTSSSLYPMQQQPPRDLHVINPEILKLASSLFSPHNPTGQIENQFPQFRDDSVQDGASNSGVSLPNFSQIPQFVGSNNNVDPSNFNDFGMNDWHVIANGLASSSPYVSSTDNYYCADHHENVMDPPILEASNFQYSNNSNSSSSTNNQNQNFSFATSVLSTPSSSPKPLTSNSTYVSGTEEERDVSYVSSSNNNIFRFEIPDMLDFVNDFM